jgi:hypothetical protein
MEKVIGSDITGMSEQFFNDQDSIDKPCQNHGQQGDVSLRRPSVVQSGDDAGNKYLQIKPQNMASFVIVITV